MLFASLVDDPIDCDDEFPTKELQDKKRGELHGIISRLAVWEQVDQSSPAGKKLIEDARFEIAQSVARSRGDIAPCDPDEVLRYLSDRETGLAIYDPFSGGGSIPLEAQRLGLKAVGSDLNPIAVLITKAMIELPARYHGRPPVNPDPESVHKKRRGKSLAATGWRGYDGVANDIRYYGKMVREEVYRRIGHLYPTVKLDAGEDATVVAWLWANTVRCTNPACGFDMPLMKTFQVSKAKGRHRWLSPSPNQETKRIEFGVTAQPDPNNPGLTVDGVKERATCLACGSSVDLDYIRAQAKDGRMRQQMLSIVAEGERGRIFLPPDPTHERTAKKATPPRRPTGSLPLKALSIRTRAYGLTEWHQLFTERQLTSLCTFGDVLDDVVRDMLADGVTQDYADTIKTYLALAIGRLAHAGSRLSVWVNSGDFVAGVFGRQAIGMVWDFAESNPFCHVTQNWMAQIEWVAKVVQRLPLDVRPGRAFKADAANSEYVANGPVIATDPPYYDNIGYADISDFFYVWHRDMLGETYPDLFKLPQTPKADEIVAGPMFEKPKERFEELMSKVLGRVRSSCSNEYPSSIFFAYKQKKRTKEGVSSTGWETFLTALTSNGFEIVATWPMRTERAAKLNALKGNLLASSVVIVVRPREIEAPVASRQQFISELESALPTEIDLLTKERQIAPIDLAQAAIGPGMKIYSQFRRVETMAGEPVSVKEALQHINRVIADYFQREQGDLDEQSRFCCDWVAEYDFDEGPYGQALVLANAKNVVLDTLENDHRMLAVSTGKVKLIHYSEPDPAWLKGGVTPDTTAWVGCMRIAWHFEDEEGDGTQGAAEVVRALGAEKAGQVERLARILFNHYDQEFQPAKARVFNEIANSWRDIQAAASAPDDGSQMGLAA